MCATTPPTSCTGWAGTHWVRCRCRIARTPTARAALSLVVCVHVLRWGPLAVAGYHRHLRRHSCNRAFSHVHPFLAGLPGFGMAWRIPPSAQLSGTWPWADCTALPTAHTIRRCRLPTPLQPYDRLQLPKALGAQHPRHTDAQAPGTTPGPQYTQHTQDDALSAQPRHWHHDMSRDAH